MGDNGLPGAGARLVDVRYTFQSAGAPSTRWRVVRVHCREALSELYQCTLDLANEDLSADPYDMLGRTAAFVIERNFRPRRLMGIVYRVEQRGVVAGHRLARVEIGPALKALSHRIDSYIFQDATIPEIVSVVLAEGLQPYGREVQFAPVRTNYLKREYCVQYRESDLHFVLRLLQEEGISFYFDHQGDKEVMVLVDDNHTFPLLEPNAAGLPVPVLGPEADTAQLESIRQLAWKKELQPTSSSVRDYDWTRPALALTATAAGQDVNGFDREVYEYPAHLNIAGYSPSARRYADADGATQAQLRAQVFKAREQEGFGESNVIGFLPGQTFNLDENAVDTPAGNYLITAVEHTGAAPEEIPHAVEGLLSSRERYGNTFRCIPADVPFRPERALSAPRIHGAQTALVVGAGQEDIYTDEHGRIKVQFHWDREGRRDEHSSCFVRVAQSWAGPGWGSVFLPRVGMEVVVHFLEGNPDRPLVIGCVYNGENPPPYALPDDKTKSTLKSSSTPGDTGSNELMFEDRAGSEKIYLHAQKDLEEVVLHDHSTTVDNNQKNHVKANQTENVDGAQSMTVGGDRTKTVHHNERSTIDLNQQVTVHQNRQKTVDVNETESIGANQTSSIGANQTSRVGANRTQVVSANDTSTVGGAQALTVGGTRHKTVAGIETDTHSAGRLSMEMGFDVNLVLGASATEVLGAYNVTALASITLLSLPSVVSILPGRIDLVAPAKLALQSGTSKIEMSPGKLTLTSGAGATIELSGADVKITGANVEVNGSAKTDVKSAGAVTVDGMLTTIKGNPVKVNC